MKRRDVLASAPAAVAALVMPGVAAAAAPSSGASEFFATRHARHRALDRQHDEADGLTATLGYRRTAEGRRWSDVADQLQAKKMAIEDEIPEAVPRTRLDLCIKVDLLLAGGAVMPEWNERLMADARLLVENAA